MSVLTSLSQYKKDLFLAFFGALLGAVLSLAFGLWNVTKTFELGQRKDLHRALRRDHTTMAWLLSNCRQAPVESSSFSSISR